MVHLLCLWFTAPSKSRSHEVRRKANLCFFKAHEIYSASSVIRTVLSVVIWVSRVYFNFSFHLLSSPDGWPCQTAQTIHHLEAALSRLCLFSSFNTPFLQLPLSLCVPLSFSPLSSHICLLRSIFPLLISVLPFFIVPLWATYSYFPLWSLSLHHHPCVLSPLTQPLLTCLYV